MSLVKIFTGEHVGDSQSAVAQSLALLVSWGMMLAAQDHSDRKEEGWSSKIREEVETASAHPGHRSPVQEVRVLGLGRRSKGQRLGFAGELLDLLTDEYARIHSRRGEISRRPNKRAGEVR